MSETLEIRQVSIADESATLEPLMRGLHEHEHLLYEKTAAWEEIADAYMRHVINMQQEYEGICLVAYLDGVAAGFIFAHLDEPDDSRIEVYLGKEYYVSDGFITEDRRGTGIYRQLNEALEAICIASGVKRISRHTLVNNVRAQRLMEAQGYVVRRLLYEKWL